MSAKGAIGICAGVAGAMFVGYCIYFDKKRRNDPSYKQKVLERRNLTAKDTKSTSVDWPNLADQEAVQSFFLTQIQKGEELLSEGEITDGIEHISRAVAVCGKPQQLLQVLQQTLPPQVFQMLLRRLPEIGESIMKMSGAKVIEEDVE